MSDSDDDVHIEVEVDKDRPTSGDDLTDEQKQQIEKEREERLDADNRPDDAEVDNTDRTFDTTKGQFTDSEEDTDLGPFRAIRWEALSRLGMEDRNFGWTVEMQLKALAKGLRVVEVPVSYRRRVGVSKITGTVSGTVKAGAKILWTIARYGRK